MRGLPQRHHLRGGGLGGGPLPAVYGHEAAGVVTQVGPGVRDFAAGDRVVVTLIRSCGTCAACLQGRPVTCETPFALDSRSPLRRRDGQSLVQRLRTAAFAEHVLVHASQAVVVPDSLPLDSASLLACGVITGFGAVTNTAAMRPGATVVVIGAGGVGLNTIQGAAITGAKSVIALDVVDAKLEAARRFGATHALRADHAGAVEHFKEPRPYWENLARSGSRSTPSSAWSSGARRRPPMPGCCCPTTGMSASARARHCATPDRSAVSASARAGCGWRASKASARTLPVDSLRCHAFAS